MLLKPLRYNHSQPKNLLALTKQHQKNPSKPVSAIPKWLDTFALELRQLQDVRKNIPEIDPVARPEDALLNVSDEESDTAVEIFGCDCIASINCLRRLRNQLP